MAFTDWLIIGGAGLLLKSGLKKAAADRAEAEAEHEAFMRDLKEREAEWDRRREVNRKRRNMPCFLGTGITYDEFTLIAKKAGKKIKRIKSVDVRGAIIYCNVESQTGYSDWDFNVDFNDWGHVTGTYWTQTDNDDSSIPGHYGHLVSGAVHELLREKGIHLEDFSDYVDENKTLETPSGLSYFVKKGTLKKLFGSTANTVWVGFDSKNLIGEHLYPVISILKNKGFKNIKSVAIKDVDKRNGKYRFQVEQVVIAGTSYFEDNYAFGEDSEVIITYHEKKEIVMPFSESKLKRENYVDVGDQLQELGFINIYERKIEDLVTGWIIKEGSVENVVIGENEQPIRQNASYLYDEEIVICYHTKK